MNEFHVDLERLLLFENAIQFFALYTDPELHGKHAFKKASRMLDIYYSEMNKNADIAEHCLNMQQAGAALKKGKVACLLSLESCSPLEENDDFEYFYCKGVRLFSLTHNGENAYAHGALSGRGGLTARGCELISKIEDNNCVLDVSHLNFESFYDVCVAAKKPFIATHSNCFEICGNLRNLKDDMIKEIISRGGICGVNLHAPFVSGDEATIDETVSHIEHYLKLGAEDSLAVGFDFDGTSNLVSGIKGAQSVIKVADRLKEVGYNEIIIDKIFFGNAKTFFEKAL